MTAIFDWWSTWDYKLAMPEKEIKMDFKFEMGVKVKDVVTGFVGVITGRAQHLTGCNTYGVNPQKVKSDFKLADVEWFDENRLSVVGKGIILPTVATKRASGASSSNPDGSAFNRN